MGPVEVSRAAAGRAAAYLAVGLFLGVVVPEAAAFWWPAGPAAPWADRAVLLVACVGLLWCRSRPLLALGTSVAAVAAGPLLVGLTTLGVLLAFGEALFSAVLYAPRRTSGAVTAATGVAAAAVAVAGGVAGGPAAAVRTLLGLAVLLGVPVWWAREVRQHRERADQATRLAELDRAAAVAGERARMARDLHDVVAGRLSGIALRSEAALALPDAPPATLRAVLGDVRGDSVAALTEMRAMIGLLRAGGAPEPPTAPAGLDRLAALLDDAAARGQEVALDDRRRGADVPAGVGLAAYRVVQEGLVNAAKHAPGTPVRVEVDDAGGLLTVVVANRMVRGRPAGAGTGTGLLGLAERAAAVGGHVAAGPDTGSWTVRAELPVDAERAS